MAINFPDNPTIGDIHTANGRSWQWDGTVWGSYGVEIVDPNTLAIDGSNNRVGINTTSPTATLDVDGSVVFSGNANIGGSVTIDGDFTVSGTTTTVNTTELNVEDNIVTLNYGVTGTPSLDAGIEVERGDETNAQLLWDESADAWVINSDFTVDTDTLHVDSANDRVGIGTTIPSTALDVEDATTAVISLNDSGGTVGGATNSHLIFEAGGSIAGRIGFVGTSVGNMAVANEDGTLGLTTKLGHSVFIRTNDTTRMTVDATGKVGISTTSPSETLDVRSANDNTSVFQHTTNGSDARIELRSPEAGGTSRAGQVFFDPDANFIGFRNGNINAMGVDSSGNVGIGTSTPSELLDVDAGTSGSVSLTTSGGRTIQLTANDSDPFLSVGSTTAHSASIMTNGIRRIIVLDDGKVGIGTSSPGYLLDVNGDARVAHGGSADLWVKTTANSSNEARLVIGGARTGSSDDNLSQLRFWNYANQSTGGDYEAARISAVDPSASSSAGNGALVFKTSSGGSLSERMRLDPSGKLGIGITTPSEALDVDGTIQSDNYIIAGKGNGGVALTHNDGQGNANVTFNHVDGTPEQTGNAARIVVNTDNASNASMSFEVKSGVTGGVNVGTTLSFRIYETSVDVVGALSKGSGSFKIPHPILEGTHNLVHSFIEGPRADLIYRGKETLVDGQATVNIDESAGMTEGTFVALNRDIQCWVTNDSGWTAVRGSVSGNVLTIQAQDSSCTDSVSWLVIGERHDQHMYDTGWTDDEGRVIVEPEIVVEETN